jgi:RND family efflux transporter MFP subunit
MGSDTQDVREERSWLGWVQLAIIGGIIVLSLSLTAWLAASSARPAANGNGTQVTAAPVEIVRPRPAAHTVRVRTTGTVRARALVSLTPEVGGQVVEVSQSVRSGARFEAGETLALIDPRNYRLAVDRAGAAYADAQSALQRLEAEAGLAREEWESLYPGEAIAPLTALEPQLEAARARVTSTRADLDQARLNLDRTRLRLPFDGRIAEARIELGQTLGAGQPYGEAYAIDALEIAVPLSPEELARIAPATGRTVRLSFEAGAAPAMTGTIVREGARLEERSRLITVFILPDDPDSLRPGLFANVSIDGATLSEAVSLPASALAGLSQVRIVRDGRIVPVDVTVLDRSEGRVVTAPFDAGEGVIVSPLPESVLGGPVTIIAEREN